MVVAFKVVGEHVSGKLAVGDYDDGVGGVFFGEVLQGVAGALEDFLVGLCAAVGEMPYTVNLVLLGSLCDRHARVDAPVALAQFFHGGDGEVQTLCDDVGGIHGTLQVARNDALKFHASLRKTLSRFPHLLFALLGEVAGQMPLQNGLHIFFRLSVSYDVKNHINLFL